MKPQRDVTIRNRHRAIIKASGQPCHICGQPIDYTITYPQPGSFVVDHVIPISKGGPDVITNKRAAHRACNSAKYNKTSAANVIRRSGALR